MRQVTIHSDGPDGTKTITLAQTGADTGTIRLVAPDHDQTYPLRTVRADVATLTVTCAVDRWLSADVTVSIGRAAAGKGPVATVTIAHAIFGNGTFVYELRSGEDQLMKTFLAAANFPALA